jgi:hypothetical protein
MFKKIGVTMAAIAFSMGLFVATSNAQYSRYRTWSTGRSVYVQPGYRSRSIQSRYYRTGRITPWEYRRLQRQRYRLYRSRDRAYRDGYLTWRERRRLARQYDRYGRTYNRVRNW